MSDERQDATIRVPTIEAKGEVFPPTITVETLWDTASLTLVGTGCAILLTIVGAVTATFGRMPVLIFAVVSVVALWVIFWPGRRRAINLAKRFPISSR
jgi:hypothetical protein